MFIMRIYLVFLCLFLAQLVFSQKFDSTVVQIHFEDSEVGSNVKNAQLVLVSNQKEIKEKTDFDGNAYFFKCDFDEKSTLTVVHPYYSDTLIKKINKRLPKISSDTLLIEFTLRFEGQMNEDFVVFSEQLPDTIFGSEKVSVADFELLPNGDILLLAYEKRLNKSSDIYLWSDGEVMSTTSINARAKELTKDFRGNVHILCDKEVISVVVDNYKRVQLGKMDKAYYFKYLAPIVDSSYSSYFFSNYSDVYPAFEYFSFDKIDSTYKELMNIQDELMMELYRSEYKWVDVRTRIWAKEMERQTGVDKVVWVGANYFTQSIYYEELYAPLFKRNDTLFVFDHYKEQLFHLDLDGNKLDSIPIFYHLNERKTGWKKSILQDKVTGQLYTIYDRAGYTYIKHINTSDGKVSNSQRLHFRYVDKMEIRNNKVYYVYRPFESVQKKFLYEEELKFDFDPAQEMLQGDDIVKNTGK